jgi:hypothetical protein
LIRPFDRSTDSKAALNWRVLSLLNLYRVLTPLMLLGLYILGAARGFAIDSRRLFFGAKVTEVARMLTAIHAQVV